MWCAEPSLVNLLGQLSLLDYDSFPELIFSYSLLILQEGFGTAQRERVGGCSSTLASQGLRFRSPPLSLGCAIVQSSSNFLYCACWQIQPHLPAGVAASLSPSSKERHRLSRSLPLDGSWIALKVCRTISRFLFKWT